MAEIIGKAKSRKESFHPAALSMTWGKVRVRVRLRLRFRLNLRLRVAV